MNCKKVMITGASSGLGEQLAYQLARKQYNLVLVARRVEKLNEVANVCLKNDVLVDVVQADLSLVEDRQKVIDLCHDVDVLINNAGYGIFQEIEQFDMRSVNHMFEVNTLAPIQLTMGVLPYMYAKKAGHIIFIASQASKIATPKTSIYAATKFGVRGFANAIRLEALSHGVHVTTVNPGPIQTDFFQVADKGGQYIHAIKRHVLTPETVAKKIVNTLNTPKREINMPFLMSVGAILTTLFPKISDKFIMTFFNKK